MNFKKTKFHFDFAFQRNKFFTISDALILAGLTVLVILGLNLGIDFKSGSRVDVMADEPITTDELKAEFDEIGLEPVQVVLAGENNEIGTARFDKQLG